MSDELEPKDELNVEEDEELMSDFQDLFSEDEPQEAGESSGGNTEDEALDELDAFLDDFEKNLDVPDASSTSAAEGDVAAQRGAGDELELDKSALDLDVGLDGEVFAEEPVLDEDELVIEEGAAVDDDLLDLDAMLDEAASTEELAEAGEKAGEDLLDLDVMMDESEPSLVSEREDKSGELSAAESVAATAVAASAAATATPAASAIIPPVAPALSRGQLLGGAVAISASLLLSLSALWMGMGLSSQIDTLNQNVSELQQRLLAQSRRGSMAPQAQLGDQLNRLGERVNELAVIVEGPVGHLRESNLQALQALDMRLERLEKGQAQPIAESKPLVSKVPVAVATTAAPTTAKRGGWVINLLSLTSARTANSELARLRKLGIRADKQTVSKDGKTWYRLRVTGFDSYAGAKAYIETVEQQTGFKSAWVAKE